ncbi:MAG: HNH endonuclease signature motif containing protein [Schleiferiaceae bacterium]|nr:HNH endonuclease signature motif containing protein [Schleiferiaceae bacterium]
MKIEKNNRRPWVPQRKPQSGRLRSDYKLYNSRAWRRTSHAFLSAHPLCIVCKKEGKTMPADVTDHITPIREGGAVWSWENLQPLCHRHHNQKSGHESVAAKRGRG